MCTVTVTVILSGPYPAAAARALRRASQILCTYSLWAGVCGQPPDTATRGGVWCVCPGRDVVCNARQAEVYGTPVSSVVLIPFVCLFVVCDSHHGPGSHVRSSLHMPAFTAPTGASPASRHSYLALTMRSVVRGPTSMPLFSVIFCSCLLRATHRASAASLRLFRRRGVSS